MYKKTFYTKCICIYIWYDNMWNHRTFLWFLFFYLKNASNLCSTYQYFNGWIGTRHLIWTYRLNNFLIHIYYIIVYFYNFFVSYASAMICLWFDKTWRAILWKRQQRYTIEQDGDEMRWELNFACKNVNYIRSLLFSCASFFIIYRSICHLLLNRKYLNDFSITLYILFLCTKILDLLPLFVLTIV